jgi:hypothetical protein
MTPNERIAQAARSKRWAIKNADKKRAQARTWYLKNRKLTIDRARRWAEQHPDAYTERMRRWNELNRPGVTAQMRAIAASLVTLFGLLPDNDWRSHLALEIVNSDSGHALGWASTELEDLLVEFTA